MKKCVFAIVFIISFSVIGISQTDVGIKGGVNLTFFNENQEDFGEQASAEVGYFGGLFVDFTVDERFHIQPEILYKGVGEFQFINVPIYAKYYVADNVSLLVGPSMNYFFDFLTNKFKVRADISAAYDVSEIIDVNLKYSLGLEELSPNVLFLGVGVRL